MTAREREILVRLPSGMEKPEAYRTLLQALDVQTENTAYWYRQARAWRKRLVAQMWVTAGALMALAIDIIVR